MNTTETSHIPVLPYFLNWCKEAFFDLNVTKTKDIDYHNVHHQPIP